MKTSQIVISINMENAAFDDGNATHEVSRILRRLATQIEAGEFVAEVDGKTLRDLNGNITGNVEVTP